MNKQEFENIAQGITPIDAATIMDLQQMQKDFPFFSLPFCFLAKHYHSKQDFRTDNVLHQAAMRVHNRQWLFDYIHNINYALNLIQILHQTLKLKSKTRKLKSSQPLKKKILQQKN